MLDYALMTVCPPKCLLPSMNHPHPLSSATTKICDTRPMLETLTRLNPQLSSNPHHENTNPAPYLHPPSSPRRSATKKNKPKHPLMSHCQSDPQHSASTTPPTPGSSARHRRVCQTPAPCPARPAASRGSRPTRARRCGSGRPRLLFVLRFCLLSKGADGWEIRRG